MKHNYNIKIDPPVPTDEQIAGQKDFGRILADYHNLTQPIYRVPLYKNPKAFLGLTLILVIAGLVFWEVEKEEKEQANLKELSELPAEIRLAEENSFLKPPLPVISPLITEYVVDVSKPQMLHAAGADISIPANAFVNADGSPVNANIMLKLRIVNSVAGAIAMGLPLQMDDKLIQPTSVLEFSASWLLSDDHRQLFLAKGKSISVEVPIEDNALQPRQILLRGPKASKWTSAATKLETKTRKGNGKAVLDMNDGFGVIEYDATGKVIPKPKPTTQPSEKPIHVLQFEMDQLGIACIGEPLGQLDGGIPCRVRFADELGQPLRLLTLYVLAPGAKTVEFLWPKTADFAFDIRINPAAAMSYIGFLPDGRLASLKGLVAMPETQGANVFKMQISKAPIKNFQDLTQRIDSLTGL